MPCAYHFSPLALALLFCRIFPFCSLGKRLTSVLDISDNQLLLPSQRLLTTNFFWPKSRLQWQVKFIQVHTSSTFATSWKVCLAVKKKKLANANARARSLSVFGGSFVTFFCKSGSHRLVTLFAAAPVSSNHVSFYRCVLNHSQFLNIYPIIHLYFGIFRYLLFISEFLIIHYS